MKQEDKNELLFGKNGEPWGGALGPGILVAGKLKIMDQLS
tara:strand:- start:389 stop:508 length:120 start_codon:yes stop_codon:yes gene_type:complete